MGGHFKLYPVLELTELYVEWTFCTILFYFINSFLILPRSLILSMLTKLVLFFSFCLMIESWHLFIY